jgi:hypothetical protein
MITFYLILGIDKPRGDIFIVIGLLTNGKNKNNISIRRKGEK